MTGVYGGSVASSGGAKRMPSSVSLAISAFASEISHDENGDISSPSNKALTTASISKNEPLSVSSANNLSAKPKV